MIRNERFIREKKAEFVLTDLTSFSRGNHRYNKIFASNVNLFWTKKSILSEIDTITSHLAKKGHLYLFYQPPSSNGMTRVNDAVRDNLRAHGFEVMDIVFENAVNCCCLVSRPAL